MSMTIQIRNVPDALHRKMKARAAIASKSLSDYLLDELKLVADRPTSEEWRARLAARRPAVLAEKSVEILRAERERR